MSEATHDRRVHAVLANKDEVVRYDRAGAWYQESTSSRKRLTLMEAVELASKFGVHVFYRLPGGMRFDAEMKKLGNG